MNKYIDTDKLIAEIERLLKCVEPHCGEAVADGSRQTLYWIKDFTISLQQEQPEVDLEKELQAFLCNYDYEFDDDAPVCDIARHFYELGLNARKEK